MPVNGVFVIVIIVSLKAVVDELYLLSLKLSNIRLNPLNIKNVQIQCQTQALHLHTVNECSIDVIQIFKFHCTLSCRVCERSTISICSRECHKIYGNVDRFYNNFIILIALTNLVSECLFLNEL